MWTCLPMNPSERKSIQITFNLPADLRLKDNAKRLLQLRFEHPDWTYEQLSKEVGLAKSRISAILNHPRVVAAMPIIARHKLHSIAPKAAKAYEELIDQTENLQVREKASHVLLKETKVFDAPTVKVEATIGFSDVRELSEFVKKAAADAPPIVDAEIISESDNPSVQ